MSFIAKLWTTSGNNNTTNSNDKSQSHCCKDKQNSRTFTENNQQSDKKCLRFEENLVRILLFKECDTRVNRSLLFDSMSIEDCEQCVHERTKNKVDITTYKSSVCEHEKSMKEDTKVLCALTFGSVSMTYKGPSFKVHAVESPASLVCAKVFAPTEHNFCRRSRQRSSEILGTTLNLNYSKNSKCSSVPRNGSSHTLDSNEIHLNTSNPSSLRRRWQRAVSTSLFPEEDDFTNIIDVTSNVYNKHRTRLGLVLLIRLPDGREKEMTTIFLEHASFIENILDRLRYSCGKGPRQNLVNRLYKATSNSSIMRLLLRLTRLEHFTNKTTKTSLLWHHLLLNSNRTIERVSFGMVYLSLQQMCHLLEKYDTKSTNFFISTIVTAVLTHHLGWVHTAPVCQNKKMTDKINTQYNCNPFWAQLMDLYGALGTPTRVTHTVIAGEPRKINLIESILHFLSYFVRSGVIENERTVTRCPPDQEDYQDAKVILERAMRRNPSLKLPCYEKFAFNESFSSFSSSSSSSSPVEGTSTAITEATNKILKRNINRLDKSVSINEKKTNLTNGMKKNEENNIVKQTMISKDKIMEEKEKFLCNFNKICLDSNKFSFQDRQKIPAYFANHYVNSKTLNESSSVASQRGFDDVDSTLKNHQVYFTLDDEKLKGQTIDERLKSPCHCRCSYTFTCVPSTSAELPEGILRKIIQRNFPESSKNVRPAPMRSAGGEDNDFGVCLKCRSSVLSRGFDNGKILETPTNATEVLRSCTSNSSNGTLSSSASILPNKSIATTLPESNDCSSDSLEALLEANGIVELPMPNYRTKTKTLIEKKMQPGYLKSLIGLKVDNDQESSIDETGYTWGMVIQGLAKSNNNKKNKTRQKDEEWWRPIRENLDLTTKFSIVDQPISEALCIIGDLDNWQVGLLSNLSNESVPVTIGMSRLVSNMLEAFVCMWKTFHSPEICIKFLESRLREMWMRSKTLADFLLNADLEDASVSNLTDFLDVDVADLPLLVSVASTHTPQISSKKFGPSLA